MSNNKTLTPAKDVDATAAADRFFATAKASDFEDASLAYKTMFKRAADAAAPVVLALARHLRDNGAVTAPDGTRARFAAAKADWTFGVALERPGTKGHLFAVNLDVPVNESQTLQGKLDEVAVRSRAKRSAEGLSGDDLERCVMSDVIFEELRMEEDLAKSGYPSDLPSPDTVSEIDSLHCCAYAVNTDYAAPGEPFGKFAARMRNAVGKEIRSVINAVAEGSYVPERLFEASPSHPRYGLEPQEWMSGHMNGGGSADWVEPFSKLASALAAAGMSDAMANSAAAVASRSYSAYALSPDGVALEEFGQALAAMDGGLPGPAAMSASARFEGRVSERLLEGRTDDLSRFLALLKDGGHDSVENRLGYDDLDRTAYVETLADGREIATLSEQNGQYLILAERDGEGEIASLSMARYGLDTQVYLDRYKERAVERVENDEYFHRDYANADDPLSPLPRDRAVEALVAGKSEFPHFLGKFRVAEGRLACEASGQFGRRTIADIANLDAGIECGRIEMEEDAARAAP